MKTVEMPKMGDTMEEGKILRWIKHEGDPVKKGESLAEVETDKVNIEIEAFSSGVLRKILVPEGESAPIGAGIALIGTPDEPLPDSVSGNGTARSAAPAPVEMEKGAQTIEAPAQKPEGQVREASAGYTQAIPQPVSASTAARATPVCATACSAVRPPKNAVW